MFCFYVLREPCNYMMEEIKYGFINKKCKQITGKYTLKDSQEFFFSAFY